ncbi:Uncharacterized protein M6B38_248215 [Iris pallida]|uniref:SWIM-type domain-containing protein n=1 Tax=Iris pallida TaxID=29817 RepID=A0AAX6DGG2_IRIPA|nr:Uncharacterized protein M6B38_248215 [Iris pallida]
MARWDEILTLPVQNPPTPEFSAADITWSRVEGWRETMDRLALIPFTRVGDFVRGESNNKDCPTRFHVEARRRRPPEMAYKPKVDGILEYILYWCSFGPDDHRKGGLVRPSRNYTAKRKTPAGRPNTKRGCVCHFIVKRLIAEPSVALIIYNQDKHVDKKGVPCHGPQDKKAAGTRAMFAPYISDELRLQIMSLLYVGVPVETIMQRHTEAVEKQGGPCNRDDLLTHRYVRRLERKIRRSTFELDSDDAVSIDMLVESRRDHVFFFEDFSESEPFILGIQTEWQLQQMIRFGNRNLLAADSRFGTNKLKCPVYSLLVFDSKNNAIPVAWIMTPNFASGEIHRWMGALYDRVRSKDPTWKLGGFIIDDPSADVNTIREVFQCSVLITFWRPRRAWHKNLIEKCSEPEIRTEISRRLGEVVSSICRGKGDVDSFEALMDDFVDCSDFMDYFKAIWYPRIDMWITALKTLPLASMEVSAVIECYHNQLKLRLLNEKDSSVYQRADWLADKLCTKVHSYYWLDEYAGKENFVRYWRDEWKSGLTSWRKALQIPDSDVIVGHKRAKVTSSKNEGKVHVVMNPGSEFATCDCSWSSMGNICMHVIKSTEICREKGLASSSTSLFEYSRTLMNILHSAPHDSVIRDHAVALAVSVQSQLYALFDQEGSGATRTTSGLREEQTTTEPSTMSTENMENADKELRNGRQPVSENNADVLGNERHIDVERNGVAWETVNGNMVDDVALPTESSSTGLYVGQHLPSSAAAASGGPENEAEDVSGERAGQENLMSLHEDKPLGDVLVDGTDEDSHLATSDQIGDTSHENPNTEMNVDIDPALFQCSPSSERLTNDREEDNASLMSDVNKINSTNASEAHTLDSTISEDEVGNGISHDTKQNTLPCSAEIVDLSLDQNNVAELEGVGNLMKDGGNEGQTSDTASVDYNYGNADVSATPMDFEPCVGDSKSIDCEENGVDREMDNICGDDVKGKRNSEQTSEGAYVPTGEGGVPEEAQEDRQKVVQPEEILVITIRSSTADNEPKQENALPIGGNPAGEAKQFQEEEKSEAA